MKRAVELLEHLAPSHAPVMILGESGTGKELVAEALHKSSPRAGERFLAVNCATLSPALIESELFGHEKGAFTGADTQRQGAFEAANLGTIFLDEVGELPLELQAKLLRVLENGEVKRVAPPAPSAWTCGWWQPPTATCWPSRCRAASARTCITG